MGWNKWLTPDYSFNKRKKEKKTNHGYLRAEVAQNIKKKQKKKKKNYKNQAFNSCGRRGKLPASVSSANCGAFSSPGAGRVSPPQPPLKKEEEGLTAIIIIIVPIVVIAIPIRR